MSRAIIGKLMGSRLAAVMLVFAFFALGYVDTPLAQDTMTFKDLRFDVWKQGASTGSGGVFSASAILAATDTNKLITNFSDPGNDPKGDGKLELGSNAGRMANMVLGRDLIIANLYSGNPMSMVSVIHGVTTSLIQAIVEGSISATNNEIIDKVTADFSRALFGFDKPASVYAGIHPTSVTGAGINPGDTSKSAFLDDVKPYSPADATTVIVVWHLPSQLVVGATDENYFMRNMSNPAVLGVSANPKFAGIAAMAFSATMAINKGDTPKHIGPSNQVGVEVANSGPIVYGNTVTPDDYALGAFISEASDFTQGPVILYDGTTRPRPYGLTPSLTADQAFGPHIIGDPSKGNVPFQFRTGDGMGVNLLVYPMAEFDGEPDLYFGAASDTIQLANNGTGTGVGFGTKSTISIKLADSTSQTVNENPVFLVGPGAQTLGNNILLTVKTTVANSLITAGSYTAFKTLFGVRDEVHGITEGIFVGAADTAAPIVTGLNVYTENPQVTGGSLAGDYTEEWAGKKITAATDAYDELFANLLVLTEGEGFSEYPSWLSIGVTPMEGTGTLATWVNGAFNRKLFFREFSSTSATIKAASQLYSDVPQVSSGLTYGVSATMRIPNNVKSAQNLNAYVVANVSDDARNPAVAYLASPPVEGASQAEISSGEVKNVLKDFKAPLTYRTINPSTVAVDNNAPSVLNATLTVKQLPDNYFLSMTSGSDDAKAIFDNLKSTTEALTAPANQRANAAFVMSVTRGTVASSANNGYGETVVQKGSPVQLVVEFQPSGNSPSSDTDHLVKSYKASQSGDMRDYIIQNFKFDIVSSEIGFASTPIAVSDNSRTSGWTLQSASMTSTVDGNNIGWATFEYNGGLSAGIVTTTTQVGVDVNVQDRLGNLSYSSSLPDNNINEGAHSSPLVLDVKKPNIYLTGSGPKIEDATDSYLITSRSFLAGGKGTPASTVLFVTDTLNNPINLVLDQMYQSGIIAATSRTVDDVPISAMAKTNTVTGAYINSSGIPVTTGADLKAGYMIILSATFQEPSTSVDDAERVGHRGAFPFLLGLRDSNYAGANADINSASSKFGELFKTIAADFSDFIAGKTEVLPDASAFITASVPDPSNPGIGRAVPGSVVAATWFFLLKSDENLVSKSDLRFATLYARDLSGNINRVSVPVGTATFAKPVISILDYQIHFTNRIDNPTARLYNEGSYGPSLPDAFAISAATMNIQYSTIRVVAKITGSEYAASNPLQGDFRQLGGGLVNPTYMSFSDTATSISTATAGTIIYATFDVGPIGTGSNNFLNADTNGSRTARSIIYATGFTGVVSTNPNLPQIQVDYNRPVITVGRPMERYLEGGSTSSQYDIDFDKIVRPGQVLTVTAEYHSSDYSGTTKDLSDLYNPNIVELVPDLAQFGNAAINRMQKETKIEDPGTNPHVVIWATYEFQVPFSKGSGPASVVGSATDAAGNPSPVYTGLLVDINASAPLVESNVLSASNWINSVTTGIGLSAVTAPSGQDNWYTVGQVLSDGSELINANFPGTAAGQIKQTTAVVRNGDYVRVVTKIPINDSAYSPFFVNDNATQRYVTADFSQVSGDQYKSVLPDTDEANQLRVSGQVITATWTHVVSGGLTNPGARIIISATNPAGIPATGNIRTVTIAVDNTYPEVKIESKVFQGGTLASYKVRKDAYSIPGVVDIGAATASFIVYATFPDGSQIFGYPAGVISAYIQKYGEVKDATINLADLNITAFNTTSPEDPSHMTPVFWAISDKSGVFTNEGSTTDGPVITNGSPFNDNIYAPGSNWGNRTNAQFIKNSTNNVITLWYGFDPRINSTPNSKTIPITEVNNASAKAAGGARDEIGNTQVSYSPGIILDQTAPTVTRLPSNTWEGWGVNAHLDVSPSMVPWVNYIPPVYANGVIARATRISTGGLLRLTMNLEDNPDITPPSPISFWLNTNATFDANGTFVPIGTSPVGTSAGMSSNDYYTSVLNPAAADVSETVTYDFNVGDTAVTTSPIVTSDPFNQANYNPFGSRMIIGATDDIYNSTGDLYSSGIEIDREPPRPFANPAAGIANENNAVPIRGGVQHVSIFTVPSLSDVNNLTPQSYNMIHEATRINNKTGGYLVVAATVVVDGTEEDHFKIAPIGTKPNLFDPDANKFFFVNWSAAFDWDYQRLVPGTNVWGSKLISIESATRALRFVTNAIQIMPNASPSNHTVVDVYMYDFFNNQLKFQTGKIAINARGPRATELTLTVNGKNQNVVNASNLGLGNRANLQVGNKIDSSSSSFELSPGDVIIVDATVTTQNNRPPELITLDLSDLFPTGLRQYTKSLVPSLTELTPQGTVHAQWKDIVYDYTGVLGIRNQNTVPPTKIDYSFASLNTIISNPLFWGMNNLQEFFFRNTQINGQQAGNNVVNATPFNGPLAGATPTSTISANGLFGVGNGNGNGGSVGTEAANAATITGLPGIVVQNGATSKRVASVTAAVFDRTSLFEEEYTLSSLFTVDTHNPKASYEFPSNQITRSIDQQINLTNAKLFEPYYAKAGRINFPTAPNEKDNIPNRVRQGDSVVLVVDVTNELIDASGDDIFRTLPGNALSFFKMSSFVGNVNCITADVAEFASGTLNGVPVTGLNVVPDQVSILPYDQAGHNSFASLIKAIFNITIGNEVGTTVASSQRNREVTPTVVDDAGNRPLNIPWDQTILGKRGYLTMVPGGLGVDNIGPSISGAVDVILNSGTATDPNNTIRSEGDVVPAGSRIVAGAAISVTVTVTELTDSPIDVLNNPNYGQITLLSTDNVFITADKVLLNTEFAELSGPDSISVPFKVQIPEAGPNVFSASGVRFVIHATDTIGNTASRISNDSFDFDANPVLKLKDQQDQVLAVGANGFIDFTLDAGISSILVKADAFDVGGVKALDWNIIPDISNLENQGIHISGIPALSATYDNPEANQYANLLLNMSADVNKNAAITGFAAWAKVVDTMDNEISSATLNVIVNQPALFEEIFSATLTSSAGIVLPDVTEMLSVVPGLNQTAGSDIREVTIDEGSVLAVDIFATDANDDTITIETAGTAVTSDKVNSQIVGSGGAQTWIFQPGYKAVSGYAAAATYELIVSAWDGRHVAKDYSNLLINVLPKPATPEFRDVVVKIDGKTEGLPQALDQSIAVAENKVLQILFNGVDEGEDDMTFFAVATPSVVFASDVVVVAPGIVSATITYKPGDDAASIKTLKNEYNSLEDPFKFTFSLTNTGGLAKVAEENIDVENTSRAPIVSASASVQGGTNKPIKSGDSVQARNGQSVVFTFRNIDPDFDYILFPEITAQLGYGFTKEERLIDIDEGVLDYELKINIPSTVAPADAKATIFYTVKDYTGQVANANYDITITIIPTVGADNDELVLMQGFGGTTIGNIRNVDPETPPVLNILRSYQGIPSPFEAAIGGGIQRAAYVSVGDVNNDGNAEIVNTFGPIIADATTPNIVVVRDVNANVVAHTFAAFPNVGTTSVVYKGGELRTAIGNFVGGPVKQIAIAQGVGGNGVVRIWRYTGKPAPSGWEVVGQFDGLAGDAKTRNASGGITLAAGDLDGDGLDELVVGQTNSNTSITQISVIDVSATGTIERRTPYAGFVPKFRGNGGVELQVADLSGSSTPVIVIASQGNTQDFAEGDIRNSAPMNVVTIVKPVVVDHIISGFVRPSGSSVLQVLKQSENPSGSISLAVGQFDGNSNNGYEIAVGSGSIMSVNGLDVSAKLIPPTPIYKFYRIDYDGNTVKGFSTPMLLSNNDRLDVARTAFSGAFAPSSNSIYLGAGNLKKR